MRQASRRTCSAPTEASLQPNRRSLEETFRALADDELLRRCASGQLTEFAQSIALAELRARGLELPAEPHAPPKAEQQYLGDWVMIARYLAYTEAHMLKSLLEAAGIPATLGDAHLVQTDALLIPAMRGASVRVPASCAAKAREVEAAFKRGDFQLDDSFEPDQQ
jgi:hypothetical protein